MGMPGLTAYGGLLRQANTRMVKLFSSLQPLEQGSVVGQIARIGSKHVIGSAGSASKVAMLKQDFGFSHAFNYKEADILGELRAGAPSGLDIYFENVGGRS